MGRLKAKVIHERKSTPKDPIEELKSVTACFFDDNYIERKGIHSVERFMVGYIYALKTLGRYKEAEKCEKIAEEYLESIKIK